MKMEYFDAQTLEEVSDLLVRYNSEAALLAGGSDLIVKLKESIVQKKYLVNLKGVSGLDQIILNQREKNLTIGALVTHTAIAQSKIIQQYFPSLGEASSIVGGRQTRNIGTIGGNICNSSPSAETITALMTFGAQVKIYSPGGEEHKIPLEDFVIGPSQNALLVGEILKEIEVPLPPKNSGSAYIKLGRRRSMEIAIVNVAVNVVTECNSFKDVKIALGAVGPTPIRAKKAEIILKGKMIESHIISKAAAAARTECHPITDVRASAEYRSEMVEVMVKQAITSALQKAENSNSEKVIRCETQDKFDS